MINKIVSPANIISLYSDKNSSKFHGIYKLPYSKPSIGLSKVPIDTPPDGHFFVQRDLITLKFVMADLKTGMLFTKDREVIIESSSWPPEALTLQQVPRPLRSLTLNSKIASLTILPSEGFYHWLIEDVPAFLAVWEQYPRINVAVWNGAPRYVSDLIRLLGLRVNSLSRFINTEEVNFLTRGADVGWPHPSDIEILRKYLQPFEPTLIRKIYISRLLASRSPEWESQLIDKLKASDWEILDLENMSLAEQISRVSEAKVLAGVHGAGLSHMIWLNRKAKVVELMGSNRVNCYSRLANACEIDFERIDTSDSDNVDVDKIYLTMNKSVTPN